MTQTVSPLTPPNCDLRDFPFMPLDVVRLRDSDIAALSSGEEFRSAVLLWCASWHQIPAASLPNDDTILAQLAGFGRVAKEWKKVKDGALRGWILCGDNRLYHPVIAEKANDAWVAKLTQRWKTECARIKKHNQRYGTDVAYPTLDSFMSPICPEGQSESVPRDIGNLSRNCLSGNSIQERGIGIGTEINKKREEEQPPAQSPTLAGAVCARFRQLGITGVNPSHPKLLGLIKAGITEQEFIDAAEEPASSGKSLAWLLAKVEGRRRDSAIENLPEKYEKPWFMTSTGIEAKASELGIGKIAGEIFPAFRVRVYSAAGVTDDMVRKAKINAGEKV